MKKLRKENKGITLIALIITIVITLILLSVATYTGLDTYHNAIVNKFVMQMQLLQSKVDELSIEEISELNLESVSTDEYIAIINTAYTNEEITTNTPNSYKVFTQSDILNILNVENVEEDILVNFDTREIISTTGIEYEGTTYYTQYKLPNGQVLVATQIEQRNLSFTLTKEFDGLNCLVNINNISIGNGTLSFSEGISLQDVTSWETITNFTENNKEYYVNISKTGTYIFKLQDNLTPGNNYTATVSIITTNKPKTNEDLEEYEYGEDSDTWAYINDSGTNYVWIPRFAYKEDANENITIKFIKGNSKIATDNTYIDDTWSIHDIFTDEDENELTGIWISVSSVNQTGLYMLDLLNDNNRTHVREI